MFADQRHNECRDTPTRNFQSLDNSLGTFLSRVHPLLSFRVCATSASKLRIMRARHTRRYHAVETSRGVEKSKCMRHGAMPTKI
jgi:hypothetical protein